MVKGIKNDEWLKLSTVYSRENLDIDSDVKISPDALEKWSYLNAITDLMSDSLCGKVGILIGSNCPRLIEPNYIIYIIIIIIIL